MRIVVLCLSFRVRHCNGLLRSLFLPLTCLQAMLSRIADEASCRHGSCCLAKPSGVSDRLGSVPTLPPKFLREGAEHLRSLALPALRRRPFIRLYDDVAVASRPCSSVTASSGFHFSYRRILISACRDRYHILLRCLQRLFSSRFYAWVRCTTVLLRISVSSSDTAFRRCRHAMPLIYDKVIFLLLFDLFRFAPSVHAILMFLVSLVVYLYLCRSVYFTAFESAVTFCSYRLGARRRNVVAFSVILLPDSSIQ